MSLVSSSLTHLISYNFYLLASSDVNQSAREGTLLTRDRSGRTRNSRKNYTAKLYICIEVIPALLFVNFCQSDLHGYGREIEETSKEILPVYYEHV